MKKILALLLVFSMLFTYVPVYAQVDTGVPVTEEETEENVTVEVITEEVITEEVITEEEQSVPDEEVEAVIQNEDEEEMIEEEQQIIDELEVIEEEEIENPNNFEKQLKTVYKYMILRDRYYKYVVHTLDKIKDLKNPVLARKALLAFEVKYERQKEYDRFIHQRVERIIKAVARNKDKLTLKQNLVIKRLYKPVVEKYYRHRTMIIHINKQIDKLKELYVKGHIDELAAVARKLEKANKLDDANKYYEKALATGMANKDIWKEAATLSKKLTGEKYRVYANNKKVEFDVQPVAKNGTTLVPIAAIGRALNAEVVWDQPTQSVIMTKGDKVVVIPLNGEKMTVNGQEVKLQLPATAMNGRILIPLRAASEALDSNVVWDGETGSITIEDNFETEEATLPIEEAAQTDLVNEEQIEIADETEVLEEVQAVTDEKVEETINTEIIAE